MSIRYTCRYCHNELGSIVDTVVSEEELGFDQLSSEERRQIVSYQNGEMVIQVVCEHCQDILDRHPEMVLQRRIYQ